MFRIRVAERIKTDYGFTQGKSNVWRYPSPSDVNEQEIARFIKSCSHDVHVLYEHNHLHEINQEISVDFIREFPTDFFAKDIQKIVDKAAKIPE